MNRKLAFTAELSLCTMVNPVLDGGRLFFVGSEFEIERYRQCWIAGELFALFG